VTISFDAIELLITQIAAMHEAQPALSKADLVLRLKKSVPHSDPETITLALDTFIARRTATEKLGEWSKSGFFVSALVEQASRQAIAEYRAKFFTGASHILEVGTGTGSDTAALARVSKHVTTVEADPIRAELAKRNLALQGIANVTFLVGELAQLRPSLDLSSFDGLFADPARRTTQGHRIKDPVDYSPPLSELLTLTDAKVRAIKVSPGLFFDALQHRATEHEWSRAFVGYGDECLEQTLWFGAPVIDSSVFLVDHGIGWAPSTTSLQPPSPPQSLSGFVSEAHAVVNRSQYLSQFFAERGIAQIAPDVAYGVSKTLPPQDKLISSFEILEAFPFSTAKLRSTLSSLGWTNRSEFKKRNFADDLEQLRSSMKLPPHFHGAPFGTILLFTWHNTPWVIIARRWSE
jgi:hypothetical protein